jgi:hypothetical protein
MAAKGMLGDLFSTNHRDVRQEEQDEEQRLQYQAQDPFRAMAHAAYTGASMAGKGLGRAVTAAAGKDPRTPTERNAAAVEAAKAQVAKLGIDPSDVDAFYKAVIDILRKQGLAADALAVANEWHDQKAKATDQKLRSTQLDIANRDLARKTSEGEARTSYNNERNRIAKLRLGTQGEPVVQLLSQLDNVQPEDTYRRRALMARIAELTKGSKVKAVDLGNRVQLIDELTGEEIREEQKGAAPETAGQIAKREAAGDHDQFAYGEVKADMQRQIDKVAELHNHPGLDGIVGVLDQYVADKDAGIKGAVATALASGPARAAAELWKSITGGTLLTGLVKLKQASKTGASGLGALSEKEGEKVQADAAALGRSQNAADMRLRLRQYIEDIKGGSDRLDAKAQSTGAPVIALKIPALTARGGRPSNNPAPRTPVVPAAAPAAPSGDRVRVKRPNGQTGSIPRAQLEAAKAAGYTEIK